MSASKLFQNFPNWESLAPANDWNISIESKLSYSEPRAGTTVFGIESKRLHVETYRSISSWTKFTGMTGQKSSDTLKMLLQTLILLLQTLRKKKKHREAAEQ
jgi:hypothetical protein